jgi:Fe-S oxidoreductase
MSQTVASADARSRYAYYLEKAVPDQRARRFLEAFAAILEHSNYRFLLDMYCRVSMKCGRCASTCQVYQHTGAERDVPCQRSELLLRVYRRHFTLAGLVKGRALGTGFLTDADVDEMADAFYRCMACRRCFAACPMGVDHGLITHLGRYVLSEIGVVPKALAVATREQLEGKSGNTSGIPDAAMRDTCEFLEEELKEKTGKDIKFPIDVEGAEYLFFPAVSDYLLEADTLMGNAAVFHAAGISWTIGSGYFDGINYGLFYNDRLLARIIRKEEAERKRLGAKKLLMGECGHASRVARAFMPVFCGGSASPEVVSCQQITLQAIEQGKVSLDPSAIEETVTYHDPCNLARSGWIVDQPRRIIRSFIKNFSEMTPNGRHNLCCGGGSGLVSIDEVRAFRTGTAGKRKADQLRATGAKIVIAPCANCKKQLSEIIEDHHLDMEVKGLHDLILRAIRL